MYQRVSRDKEEYEKKIDTSKEELEEVKAELENIKESQKEATGQKKASESSEAVTQEDLFLDEIGSLNAEDEVEDALLPRDEQTD